MTNLDIIINSLFIITYYEMLDRKVLKLTLIFRLANLIKNKLIPTEIELL